jgi:hypothetical protein
MNSVLIELKADSLDNKNPKVIEKLLQKNAPSFKVDSDYPVVPMKNSDQNISSYLVRGVVDRVHLKELKALNIVLRVFDDTPIKPF